LIVKVAAETVFEIENFFGVIRNIYKDVKVVIPVGVAEDRYYAEFVVE
jgi:hypothetical protein